MTEIFTSNTISVLPSWKGETLEQITTSIRKNGRDGTISERNLFVPQPLKHYRREIASKDNSKIEEVSFMTFKLKIGKHQ